MVNDIPELNQMNSTNTVPTVPIKYAGFWIRLVASVVDTIILAIPVAILQFATIHIFTNSIINPISVGIIKQLVYFLTAWLYFVSMTYSSGATLGKKLVGITVKSDDFQKLSFLRVFFRETIGKIISTIILGIGYIMAGFGERKQALHDKFVGSVVLYKDPLNPSRKGLIVGIVLASILPMIAILGMITSIALLSLNSARMKAKEVAISDTNTYIITDSTYENTKYYFKFNFPVGSIFSSSHPESGFVTRFFIPNGESIENDQENVGIYIKENSDNLETEVQNITDHFSKNGPIDTKEVQFGGQKGYRIILTSDYTLKKGTQELFYITVKNGIAYELNYFPVAKNITVVDTIASSFKFTQ